MPVEARRTAMSLRLPGRTSLENVPSRSLTSAGRPPLTTCGSALPLRWLIRTRPLRESDTNGSALS
eukprot:8793304-Lingulodinium_polyedra.AAC.1